MKKQGISFYRGDDPAFVMPVFSRFDKTALVSLFAELGIYPFVRDGYYYPYSGQASAVQEILEAEVRRLGVSIACGQRAVSIQKRGRRFLIATETDHFQACTCIVAAEGWRRRKPVLTDSACGRRKPSDTESFPPIPLWCPMTAKGKFLSQWAGVRARGVCSLYVDGHLECEDEGELQLTKDGISGIPVFQVSRYAAKGLYERKQVRLSVDFVPELSDRELLSLFRKTCGSAFKKSQAYAGRISAWIFPGQADRTAVKAGRTFRAYTCS